MEHVFSIPPTPAPPLPAGCAARRAAGGCQAGVHARMPRRRARTIGGCYTDTTPLPATAQKWTYRAIFRDGEGRIGQWSPVVSIIVAA